MWALIYSAAWCCASQDDQAGTISSMLAAIQYFPPVDVGIELSIRSPLIKTVLQVSRDRIHWREHGHGFGSLYRGIC